MNTKQLSTWTEIVQQCKSGFYSSINVASKKRSDAIVAVDALVKLVTPELAELLKRLSNCTLPNTFGAPYVQRRCVRDRKAARELAARIREVLEETE